MDANGTAPRRYHVFPLGRAADMGTRCTVGARKRVGPSEEVV